MASCRQVLQELDAYVTAAGPFDAVMAFSMGASLAATLMVRSSKLHATPPFSCAVFFCGGVPSDPLALDQNQSRQLSYSSDGEIIGIPTAHIWGKNDPRASSFGSMLSQLSNSKLRTIYVHDGGHEIPGARDRVTLMKAVDCIRTTVERAHTLH